jgi:uncharacterized protein YecT (DUF1311 family)
MFCVCVAGVGMRTILLAIMAIQLWLGHPAYAEDSPDTDRLTVETLPLFEQNHCAAIRNPADLLFCGDPELNAIAEKLNGAIRGRLDRLSDRRLAIAENAEWVRDRNSSCGILPNLPVRKEDIPSVKNCLLKEAQERIAILNNPNFDCLAANTAAGALICSDPSLAIAEAELNNHALALIAKLKEDDAKEAFAEYGRWIRDRDRKCNLVDKDNVPLDELSSSEGCLADIIAQKTAELVAAKGDPKRVFGRHPLAVLPDADAVDLCVAQIHAANACGDFLSVNRVIEFDTEATEQSAQVIAEVEMMVLSPFAVCSPVASGCTGTCWDLKSGKAKPTQGSRDSFSVAHRLRIEKSFDFQKTDNGWRCSSAALEPIDLGTTVGAGP